MLTFEVLQTQTCSKLARYHTNVFYTVVASSNGQKHQKSIKSIKSICIYTLRYLELKIGFLWGSLKSSGYKMIADAIIYASLLSKVNRPKYSDGTWWISADKNLTWCMLIQIDERSLHSLTQKVVFFCRVKPLKWTISGSGTTQFGYLKPFHLKTNLNVPPMCFLSEGLLNWHIPEYTNPQGCNKPKLQSWH